MSPETIARSVQRLNAAGVAWPTTRRVAITVRLAGLADVIALGDGVVGGPTAARAAVGHVLRAAGRETDPAAALREIAKVQRVLSVMEPPELVHPTADPDPQVDPDPLVEPVETEASAASSTDRSATSTSAVERSATGLPIRPVRTAGPVTEGPA
ncbi:hypothetical protein C8K30_103155 [Promicromonospora sp. AC04]|uniref:hypothetical protein n=1 Tax=Promicromonospora sp. AC04 TaxID=2135723 RepID=UPI000D38E6F8|nr:hypothetical protein [Promicromonospora sp. AC04]PUB28734.1 hypothetical protein C8K30_103155 [Promicromonospora sp. AC04]